MGQPWRGADQSLATGPDEPMKHIPFPDFGSARHKDRPAPRRYVRTLFLSDLHLGARACQAEAILSFLSETQADTIYLVGDIFDAWQRVLMKWDRTHDAVVQDLMARAREGVRIVFVPGNHDEVFRRHYGIYFDHIEVVEDAIHTTADGRRFFVVHGDCVDPLMKRAAWISKLGTNLEAVFRWADMHLGRTLQRVGLPDPRAVDRFIALLNGMLRATDDYELRLIALARGRRAQGVICGHYHKPALHSEHGIVYANCGDWVEHCTALTEDHEGRLSLVGLAAEPEAGPEETIEADADDLPGMAV